MSTEVSTHEISTQTIARGRGRPRKEKPPAEPKKIGRPRKEINITEIREKMKPGPKTSKTQDPEYFNNYYRAHYKGVYTTCPACNDPRVRVDKIQRHINTLKCLKAEVTCKFC